MNQKLVYLPCLKHKEGSPTAWPALHISYSELESCGILLHSTPLRIVTAYYASAHAEFPTCLRTLTSQLSRIVDDSDKTYKLLTNYTSKIKKQLGDGSGGSHPKKMSPGDPIPKKGWNAPQRGGGNQANTNGNSGKKGCDLCKK